MSRLPARSVELGLTEATQRWPRRSTASDGMLGDPAHASRVSDHNADARGIVHAFDLTHDPGDGVDCNQLAELIRERRDSRVKYVIWRRRIYLGPHDEDVQAGRARPWVWFPYDGENPHTLHMHVSVGHTPTAENDLRPWYGAKEELSMAEVEKILAGLAEIKQALAVQGSTGPDQTQELLFGNVKEIKTALAVQGSTGPKETVEKLYGFAKAADAKAAQALVAIAELRKLVEQALLPPVREP